MTPVLSVRGLAWARPEAAGGFALEIPSLRVAPGEIVALAGESGSGKTTALDLLGLLRLPDLVAEFRLAGEDVAARLSGGLDAVAGLRRERIGHVLQQGGLLPFLTVAENIALTARPGRAPPFALGELAERLGLAGVLDRSPEAVSIGQRQRVAIARAVMGDPALILADEPTAALDPPTAREVLSLLLELARARGAGVVMASHSWGLIAEFALPVLRAEVTATPAGPRAVFRPAEVAA